MPETNWTEVTEFFNGVIDEVPKDFYPSDDGALRVAVYSSKFDQTLTVKIPGRNVEEFLKGLGLFEAEVHRGTFVIQDWRDKY